MDNGGRVDQDPAKLLALAVRLTVFVAVIATVGSSAFAATRGGLASTRGGATIIVKYSGKGSKKLRPFRLTSGATLAWTNTGFLFTVDDYAPDRPECSAAARVGLRCVKHVPVVLFSQAHRGSTYLTAGRHQFSIIALGDWTITIRKASLLAGSSVLRFKGHGESNLIPFKTGPRGANVTWANTGSGFGLYDNAQNEAVVDPTAHPRAHRGTTYLGSGRHQLDVIAVGNWTLTVKPR